MSTEARLLPPRADPSPFSHHLQGPGPAIGRGGSWTRGALLGECKAPQPLGRAIKSPTPNYHVTPQVHSRAHTLPANESRVPESYLLSHIHSSVTHKSQNMDTTQVSINK